MKTYELIGIESIHYEDWEDLMELLEGYPENLEILNAKRGWCQVSFSKRFKAYDDGTAIRIVDAEYGDFADTCELYRIQYKKRTYIEQFHL